MSAAARLEGSAGMLGLGSGAIAALCMSINAIAVTFVYKYGSNAQTVALLRYVFFIAVFLAILPFVRPQKRFGGSDYLNAIGCGAVSAIGSIGLLGAFMLLPVSLAIIITYTNPILTAVFSSLLTRRLPGIVQVLCLLAALVGVALTIGIDATGADWRGVACATLASFCFAASFAWNGFTLADADGTSTTFWMSLSGLLIVAGFVLASGTFDPPPQIAEGWIALLVSSAAFSFAFFCMFRSVQLIGPAPAAMIMNIEPVLTVMFAAVVLREELTPLRLLGGAMVLAAVVISELKPARPRRQKRRGREVARWRDAG